MRELVITGNPSALEVIAEGRWTRHFKGRPTRAQILFDLAFGILLPLLCLEFDPIVFAGGSMGGGGLFPELRLIAYLFILFEMAVLALWLSRGPKWRGLASLVSGALYCGFAGSFLIGLLLFPLSVIGLFLFGIGLFGFTPFLTSFVFLRNAVRAGAVATSSIPVRQTALATILGLLIAVAVATNGDRIGTDMIAGALAASTSENPAVARSAEAMLLWARPVVDYDQLVWQYHRETDVRRRTRLASAYRRLTGRDIESRLTTLLD